MNFKRLKLMRAAARVKRVHTTFVHHQQTVGEHTFGVLCLLHDIISPRNPSPQLIKAALYHDAPEAINGDVPGPVKSQLREHLDKIDANVAAWFELDFGGELDPWEEEVLTYCDKMEFVIYALEEVDSGNSLLMPRVRNSLASIRKRELHRCTPAADALLIIMEERAKEYPIDLGENCTHGYHG